MNDISSRAPGRTSSALRIQRRRWLQWLGAAVAGSGAGSQVLAQAGDTEPPRLALLIGNRDYPDGDDLPPIHKNVNDLRTALEHRGFKVTVGLDLDLAKAQAAVTTFAAQVNAAPPEATVFFYFSGHGAQVDSENLLVSARLSPKARPETLARGSLTLGKDVVGVLPHRPKGLTIAVVDACRTSIRDVAKGEGLNQVEAPPGCLIAFATGAGKPAIAPADDTRNTFYTGSLVKLMGASSDEITFSRPVPAGEVRRAEHDAEPPGAAAARVRAVPVHRREHAGGAAPGADDRRQRRIAGIGAIALCQPRRSCRLGTAGSRHVAGRRGAPGQ